MKTENKNKNAFTVNIDDDLKSQLLYIAAYYQRKPAELLRLLLKPVLINEYATIMQQLHSENKQPIKQAIFKN